MSLVLKKTGKLPNHLRDFTISLDILVEVLINMKEWQDLVVNIYIRLKLD